jgi:hypothetical protein
MQEQRLFTLDEALALLPRLREILADLRQARAAIADAQQILDVRYQSGHRTNGHVKPGGEVDRLMETTEDARNRLTAAVRAIAELGCELKDPDRGMIDFRSMRDGRVVYLCWLADEPTIAYWHELDGGFRGRQPLEHST